MNMIYDEKIQELYEALRETIGEAQGNGLIDDGQVILNALARISARCLIHFTTPAEFDETLKGFQRHVAGTADIMNQEWLANGSKTRDDEVWS
jgi:hypothetical protein